MPATEHATAAYHQRFDQLLSRPLGRTGLTVSAAGFGCYRVADGVPAHHEALRLALQSGINLIDTSANYADGNSERLIGRVVAEMIAAGSLRREEVVVVTKGGYIQAGNMAVARERVAAGSGFPEVVEYAPGLWHCIAPEFLEDQITRSLDRLGMPSVDVFLLHNPEYYLGWAAKAGIPLEEARAEYYRRVANAFAFLETEVERGRIGWYGISSNSFPHPAADADFTSLDECIGIAERISLVHHFAVIQFPANLMETGFVTEANNRGGASLVEAARSKNLGMLVNRPLNAIVGGELVRLADFPAANEPFDAGLLQARINSLVELEKEFAATHLVAFADDPEASTALQEYISIGSVLDQHWREFGTIEHFNDLLGQYFAPRINAVRAYLRGRDAESELKWFQTYLDHARAAFDQVTAAYTEPAQQRSNELREVLHAAIGGSAEGTFSALALRMILGVEGITSVLVGMRRAEYVDDVVGALRAGPLGDRGAWDRL